MTLIWPESITVVEAVFIFRGFDCLKVASSLLAELVGIRIGMRGSTDANVALGRFAVNCAFKIRRLRTEKKSYL